MWRRRQGGKNQNEQDCAERQAKINELRAAIGPLSGHSFLFCSDACLRRYLEARNWNLNKAKKMLEETLKWRAAYKPEEILWDEVALEGETGKIYRANYLDRLGRTVIVLRPGKQNTTSQDDQLRHLVYLLENAVINLPSGQEQMVWLIDFSGWSLSNSVPIKTARETANILQNHYPERLAVALLYNPPRIFEAFWKVVKFFLDLKTVEKVKFIYTKSEESASLMQRLFDLDKLQVEFGGKNNSQYDHTEFSKLMRQDDIKTADYWATGDKLTHLNGNSTSEPDIKPDSNAPEES
ncbi:uncharacterized protein LOC131033289 [Cryptomeria japonica]|uniref:uncharacterized protein LOC131033289 n=1 Tax=Cryptomeria japonica TaxID=3369 RepID=UPI0025ABDC2B|nr:uncharacterized protein LOC131033289 [Cryptomeria japonica]XP_057820453.1 uncharacterized protein LOC131033289 [Cryptomeria japonica]